MATLCPVCEVPLAINVRRPQIVKCGACRARLQVTAEDGQYVLKEIEEAVIPSANARACRKCGCAVSTVLRTIPPGFGATYILRRRQCRHCGHRWSTREERVSG